MDNNPTHLTRIIAWGRKLFARAQGTQPTEPRQGPTWAEILPKFFESRKAMGLRAHTLRNYGCFVRRAARNFSGRTVASLTREEYQGLVKRGSRRYAEDLRAVVTWALKEGLIQQDVTRGALPRVPRQDKVPPGRLSPAEAQRYFHLVPEQFKAAFALAMYAGLRPYECLRIDWSSIHVAERRVRIEAAVSKIRRERLIEGVPTILWAQLALREQRQGPVFPRLPSGEIHQTLYQRVRNDIASRAHVRLSHDVFRHSFATYYIALTGSPDRAAKILGHYKLRTLAAHYDGVATKREAEQYFHPRPILALPPIPKPNEEGQT